MTAVRFDKLVLAGAQRRFPHRAFVNLAVAHDHDDAGVALLDARRQRHADAVGQTMAERTGRRLDARNFRRFRMSAEDRVAAAEGVERLVGNEALFGQHDILRDAAVALAQDHAVAARPFWLIGAKAQNVVVEHAHDFDERHRGADMAALAAVKRAHRRAGADVSTARRAAGSRD